MEHRPEGLVTNLTESFGNNKLPTSIIVFHLHFRDKGHVTLYNWTLLPRKVKKAALVYQGASPNHQTQIPQAIITT